MHGIHSSTLRLPCPQKKDAHAISDAQLEKEREQLAKALERLADVQHELADGQRNLMNGELMPAACFHWEGPGGWPAHPMKGELLPAACAPWDARPD